MENPAVEDSLSDFCTNVLLEKLLSEQLCFCCRCSGSRSLWELISDFVSFTLNIVSKLVNRVRYKICYSLCCLPHVFRDLREYGANIIGAKILKLSFKISLNVVIQLVASFVSCLCEWSNILSDIARNPIPPVLVGQSISYFCSDLAANVWDGISLIATC